jgi:biopolymer transport protein ExbD
MRKLTHPLTTGMLSSGIDLAPMLDFVTNLLIFFLITAVFLRQPGIAVKRPDAVGGPESVAKSIVIDDHGAIAIDNQVVDLHAVRAHLEQYRAARARQGTGSTGGVIIVAHERAPTGVVVSVADQVSLGGIHDITFSTAQSAPEVAQ